MKSWQEDHLNSLLTIESEQELFDEIALLAKDMGFDYCAYGIQMSVPISRPFVASFNNFSKEWHVCQQERGHYLDAATVAAADLKTNHQMLVSADDVFVDTPELWNEARTHGLHYGWTQFSRDASGSVGMLTLARTVAQLSEYELFENKIKMAWLAQFSHATMSRLLVPKYAPETLITMTLREKEVLRWTAEGKTAYEIGQILAVSERTVNFHINNVVTKLGASNKTQAAVKAATLGMLA
ncbi:MAG TPA: autoinducer binding domain-containing protein [Burkholderiaceae bacterium]|jgi:LuxR family quorum-sensing system transcriptional regulator SolR|nr:autoinducer binding domain-containing protein [Burkholderiaceae bacterium]